MAVNENTLRRGAVAVSEVARAEFMVAADSKVGHPLARGLLGLMFVLACLPFEHRALATTTGGEQP